MKPETQRPSSPLNSNNAQPTSITGSVNNTLPTPSDTPYSIFDKRQKALIIGIVSTAATCTQACSPSLAPPSNQALPRQKPAQLTEPLFQNPSLRLRLKHLLPRHTSHSP